LKPLFSFIKSWGAGWSPAFVFVSLGMIKLIAAYRPTLTEGRKVEITSGPKLRQELTGTFRAESLYQCSAGHVYTYGQLYGQEINFTDNIKYFWDIRR
jgi:hypothetical protein